MWDVIVLIPDHCLSIYFTCSFQTFIFTDLSIRYIDMVNVSCLLLASVRSDLFGGGGDPSLCININIPFLSRFISTLS